MASKDVAVEAVANNREEFREDFGAWLFDNFTIYQKFEYHARAVAKNRKHWSARTIIEFMRHSSAIRENGDGWKLNNDRTPDIARLFAILNPEHKDLFEYRTNASRVSVSQMARAS